MKTERATERAANLTQCWGRNKPYYLTRCGRFQERRYCDQHRAQSFVLPGALLLSLLAVVANVVQVVQFFDPVSAEQRELERRVYTKISLIAHGWKIRYWALHPDGMNATAKAIDGQPSNLWKQLQDGSVPEFNKENWIRYRPLFNDEVGSVCRELHATQAAYSDVLKPELRVMMENTCLSLIAARNAYYAVASDSMGNHTPMVFRGSFLQTFRDLGALDDEVQRLREAIPKDGGMH